MAAVCFTMFIDQSGNTSDMEPSFEWIWQKMPHGKGAASVLLSSHLPSTSSTKHGYGQAWERSEPLVGLWVGMLVQWEGQHCSVASRAPEPAALLGRHAGEEACSLLRNAGWPQASGVFSKEVLTFASLRVQQTCAFLLLGGWWGMRKSCFVGVF